MDQFGQEVININNEWINIPRSILCRSVYRNVSSVILSEYSACSYVVRPHIDEDYYTSEGSLQKVKRAMWLNLFDFEKRYQYNEDRHYPHIFSAYLKSKLDIDINITDRLDLFIEQVRNSMFVCVTYTCSPIFIGAARWLSEGATRMENSRKYVIAVDAEEWIK